MQLRSEKFNTNFKVQRETPGARNEINLVVQKTWQRSENLTPPSTYTGDSVRYYVIKTWVTSATLRKEFLNHQQSMDESYNNVTRHNSYQGRQRHCNIRLLKWTESTCSRGGSRIIMGGGGRKIFFARTHTPMQREDRSPLRPWSRARLRVSGLLCSLMLSEPYL